MITSFGKKKTNTNGDRMKKWNEKYHAKFKKYNGKMRQLGVPLIKDRIAQQALKNVLEPIFENIFLPHSHGYRPNTDAHVAVRKAEAYINAGGNLSPLLANIYLNHFDRRMGEYGYLLLRYADDIIIIFCKYEWEAEDALKRAKEILERELKLKLSPEKTRIVHGNETGVEFLCFHFNGRWKKPRDKAVKKFKSEVKQRTRRQQPISLGTVIKLLNPIIRGWGNYFDGCTEKGIFKDLDEYIMERLRGISG